MKIEPINMARAWDKEKPEFPTGIEPMTSEHRQLRLLFVPRSCHVDLFTFQYVYWFKEKHIMTNLSSMRFSFPRIRNVMCMGHYLLQQLLRVPHTILEKTKQKSNEKKEKETTWS